MVAVAYREYERLAAFETVFFVENRLASEFVKRFHRVLRGVGANYPTLDVTTSVHKVKVIKRCEIRPFLRKRFYNRSFGVVDKYHDVRKLYRRVFSYLNSRRNAFENRSFRRADKCFCSLFKGIIFEVEFSYKSFSHGSVGKCPFKINKTVDNCFEFARFEIFFHFCVNFRYSFFFSLF